MAGLSGAGGGGAAIRAGRAFVEIFAEDNKVYRALDRIKTQFRAFGAFTAKVGAVVGAAGLAALAPLKPAIDGIVEGGKMADAAEAFGLTAKEASRLFGIMRAGGSDLRDATEGLVTFNQRIEDAISGSGEEAQKLFDGLGRGPEEFQGGNTAQRFYQLIDALRQVPDPAKRVQLLLKAVGEDTGKNLIPLLSMTNVEMSRLGDVFETSAESLKTQRDASRAYTLAVAGIGRVWSEVVVALAPSVQKIAEWISRAVGPVSEFLAKNRETVVTVAAVAAGLVATGVALISFGAAASAAGVAIGAVVAGVKLLAAAVAFLLSPIGLVVAAVAGLAYVFRDELMAAATEAWGYLTQLFEGVGSAATETWTGIVAAIQKGDLELAFKVASAGVKGIWAELMLSLRKGWNDFVRWLVNYLVKNPWILPTIGAVMGFAVGGPGGMVVGAGAGTLSQLGISAFKDDIKDFLTFDTSEAEANVAKARAELAAVVNQAKAPKEVGGGSTPAPEPSRYAPVTPRDLGIVAARGTFTSAMARGQLGSGDTFQKHQKKVSEQIEKNTRITAEAAGAIVEGLKAQQ